MKLEGTFCALATPFTSDDEIDEEGYRANINFLIENGVDGLVAAGTSGESATITHEEQKKLREELDFLLSGLKIDLEAVWENGKVKYYGAAPDTWLGVFILLIKQLFGGFKKNACIISNIYLY